MKFRTHRTGVGVLAGGLTIALLAAHLLAAAPATAAPSDPQPTTPVTAPTSTEIRRAVRDLGDESFETRERASKLLWSAGDAAREALRQAAEGDDPEIASRAKKLLANLDLGVRPDTPPEVAAAVQEFAAADAAGKGRVLDTLGADIPRNRAVLRRLWLLPVPEGQRRRLFAGFSEQSRIEARRLLAGEAPDLAEPFLEAGMAAGEETTIRDFATFALVRSSLPRQVAIWKALAEGSGGASAARVLAFLYRADGDLAAAAGAAERAGDERLRDRLLYEAGEWKALAALPPARLAALEVPGLPAYCLRAAGDVAGSDHALADAAVDDLLNDKPAAAVESLVRQGRAATAVELLAGRLEFDAALKLAERAERENPGRNSLHVRTARAALLARLGRRDGPGGADALFRKTMADALAAGDSGAAIDVVRAEVAGGMEEAVVADAGAVLGRWDNPDVQQRLFGTITNYPEAAARYYRVLSRSDRPGGAPDRPPAAVFALQWDAQRGRLTPDGAKALAETLDAATVHGAAGGDRPWWLEQCGNLNVTSGRFDLAEGYFRQMMDGYHSTWGAIHLADLAFRRRQWNKSAELYARAREMDPALLQSTYLMGRALIGARKQQEGQRWVEWAALQPLADESERARLADSLDWHELPADAHEQRAITLRTGAPGSRYAAGVLARESERAESAGDYRRAAVLCERAVLEYRETSKQASGAALLEGPARVHGLHARALLKAGDAEGAAREAGLALDLVPGDVDLVAVLVSEFDRGGQRVRGDVLLRRTTAALAAASGAFPESPMLRESAVRVREISKGRQGRGSSSE